VGGQLPSGFDVGHVLVVQNSERLVALLVAACQFSLPTDDKNLLLSTGDLAVLVRVLAFTVESVMHHESLGLRSHGLPEGFRPTIQTSRVVAMNFHGRLMVEPQSRIKGISRMLRFFASVRSFGRAM